MNDRLVGVETLTEQQAANLNSVIRSLAHADPTRCLQQIGEHICQLHNCPNDDPEWMHQCYAGDCDWTAKEWVQIRRGEVDERLVRQNGGIRAAQRIEREAAAAMRAEAPSASEIVAKDAAGVDPWAGVKLVRADGVEVGATWDCKPTIDFTQIEVKFPTPELPAYLRERLYESD